MKSLDAAVMTLAARQHNVFTRAQAVAICGSPSACDRRLRSGAWVPTGHAGVYALAASPPSWRQQLMAAVLAGPDGAVASHRSAAVLSGLREGTPIEVTVPRRSQNRLRAVIVHQRLVDERDVTRVDGIPTTKPERTLLDLAAVVDELALERAVEAALRRGLTTRERLSAYGDAAGRRRGAARFRGVLGRCSGGRPTGSELEVRFLQLLRSAGVEEPARQVEVRIDGRRYFLDFAYPARRLAIELDGRMHHGFEEDGRRQNDLVLAGWTLLRFTWADVTERGGATVAAVTLLVEAA